jgi:hypothetical protein
MAAKAKLCQYISQVLGISILRLVKMTGKEPTYRMVLEDNTEIEFPSVGKLIDQKMVRVAVASAVNRLIPKIKPRQWESLVQVVLDALIEEDAGPENETKGAIRVFLGRYLADSAFIPAVEGQPSNAIGKPMVIDGQIAVNANDLQMFIVKTFGQNIPVKAAAAMLSALGAKSIRLRSRKFPEQGRWLLPVDEFNPADFTLPAQRREESNDALK